VFHNDRCTFAGEEGHFICGCGDCACGGWDGGHQCGPYSCRCQEALCGRGGGAHRLLEGLINFLIATEKLIAVHPGVAQQEMIAALLAVESITGRTWRDIRKAVLAERGLD